MKTIVIDNWYEDPDEVRQLAFSNFETAKTENVDWYPGIRTYGSLDNLLQNREKIEYHCGFKVNPKQWVFNSSAGLEFNIEDQQRFEVNLSTFNMVLPGTDIEMDPFDTTNNGTFQCCLPEHDARRRIHVDERTRYGAIIYLTPDPPEGTGTGFFRHKDTNITSFDKEHADLFQRPREEWEMIDSIENIYNRCIIFDSQQYHAATKYFGTDLSDGRLTQVFFFNRFSE